MVESGRARPLTWVQVNPWDAACAYNARRHADLRWETVDGVVDFYVVTGWPKVIQKPLQSRMMNSRIP